MHKFVFIKTESNIQNFTLSVFMDYSVSHAKPAIWIQCTPNKFFMAELAFLTGW